jgi:hypothetical protein
LRPLRAAGLLLLAGAGAAGATDALVPGTRYHATGEVPCAAGPGQPLRPCPFGVVRQGGGRADVTLDWPDGVRFTIRFAAGGPVGHDGPPAAIESRREDDMILVGIGPRRVTLPEAVLTGG